MGTVVLDSSVIIAIFDAEDAHHESAMTMTQEHHFDGNDFAVPTSVLSEVLVGSLRRDANDVDQYQANVQRLFGPTRVIDLEVAVQAAKLRAQHRSLRLPDALVIATGIVDDADVILTADKRWAGVDDRVRVLGQ